MERKLNHVARDPGDGSIVISLRPRSRRRPAATLEYAGRVALDLDAEGDVYGIRLIGASDAEAGRILAALKTRISEM
jgi:uncharacterized protein YuzE